MKRVFLTQRGTKSVCAGCIGTQSIFMGFRRGTGGACGHGVRVAKQRTAPRRGGASREARRPTIAPYRNGARVVVRTTGCGGRGSDGDMRNWVALFDARLSIGSSETISEEAKRLRA